MKELARKRIVFNKTESLLTVVAVALAISVMIAALSLSINYTEFFINEAENLTDRSMEEILDGIISNLEDIGEYAGDFIQFFNSYQIPEYYEDIVGPPIAYNSRALFSPDALIENLPVSIAFMILIALFTVFLSLSVVFSACKRERRAFFATLLVSGASDRHIKKCAFYEGIYYCVIALPFGYALGLAEIYSVKFAASQFFGELYTNYTPPPFPVEIRFSFISIIFTLPIIFLLVCGFSKGACKKLSVKTTASDIRKKSGADIGICTFSANPQAYKRKGIEFYIASRNFQNNFGKYFKIIFMTVLYTGILSTTIIVFNAVRNYNDQEISVYKSAMLDFSFAAEFYFCSIAALVALLTVVSTFIAVWANTNSNTGEYALMRSSGASVRAVLKAVRIEGYICNFSGVILSIFYVIYFLTFMNEIYAADSNVVFSAGAPVFVVLCVAVSAFSFSVLFTIFVMNKKMKSLDTVSILKEYLY